MKCQVSDDLFRHIFDHFSSGPSFYTLLGISFTYIFWFGLWYKRKSTGSTQVWNRTKDMCSILVPDGTLKPHNSTPLCLYWNRNCLVFSIGSCDILLTNLFHLVSEQVAVFLAFVSRCEWKSHLVGRLERRVEMIYLETLKCIITTKIGIQTFRPLPVSSFLCLL